MGANIGTTITNTLVSMGHILNRQEFKRAFSASIVHDFFNICAVIVFFPIEMNFHIIAKMATFLEGIFAGAGGMKIFNPLNFILKPTINLIDQLFVLIPFGHIVMLVLSVILLMLSLIYMVKTIRSLMLEKIEIIINNYLFRNDFLGLSLGTVITATVQSSSVTTSLIIPLAGAGLVSLRKIFPYTLGANIGTTVTAILAALATQNPIAITVAFSHLCFNILGILVFYPLRFIPIRLSEFVGEKASKSKKNLITFIVIYILLHFIPVFFIFIF
jgi:sodium-dependent phosphate cotransporter